MHTSKHPEAVQAADYKVLKISSTAFEENGHIPVAYTCDGADINPPLHLEGVPQEAQSLAIIVDDPDAPAGTWTHWVAWNIPVTHQIKENIIHGLQGMNDFGKHRYNGPCPPSGRHRYFYKVYALDTVLELSANARKHNLEVAMSGHIIAFGELIGTYSRS